MPIYTYVALDENNKEINGEMETKNRDEVATALQSNGYKVLSIEEKVDYLSEITGSGIPKVKLKVKVIFAKQLSTMLGAGLPITQALEIIVQQTKDKALKRNIQQVLDDIQKSGMALSDAMEKNTKLFNEVQISLLRAGETSGNLNDVLVKIAEDLEDTKKLRGKIQGAMIYPAIIFVVIIAVVAVMMIYMIPAVEILYQDFGVGLEELPAVTRILISISDFMTDPISGTIFLVLLVSGVISLRYYISTPGGRLVYDKFLLKIPVIGNLISLIQVTEFCRLLSMLMRSGVPIIKSLTIVAAALSNIHFKKAILDSLNDISNGVPLAVPLSKSDVYPPLIVRMVAIGEETGKLDSVLSDMANFFDAEVQEISENLNKLMEPMILVIVGGLVAFLAVGIYLPIYNIGNVI